MDISLLRISKRALDLLGFSKEMKRQIETARKTLLTKWFPQLQEIYLQGFKKGIIPDNNKPKANKRFFDCTAIIMTYQLQTLCLKSILDYTAYLQNKSVILNICLFVIFLVTVLLNIIHREVSFWILLIDVKYVVDIYVSSKA